MPRYYLQRQHIQLPLNQYNVCYYAFLNQCLGGGMGSWPWSITPQVMVLTPDYRSNMVTHTPIHLLCIMGLAAMRVSSAAIPKSARALSQSSYNATSVKSGELPILETRRWGNGTFAYYGWLENTPDADINSGSGDSSGGTAEMLMTTSDQTCPKGVYVCNDLELPETHASGEACETLIQYDLKQGGDVPRRTRALCYWPDWDHEGAYKCCTSWTRLARLISKIDLVPEAVELFEHCKMYDSNLGIEVMSGTATSVELGGSCTKQCLTNRSGDCGT